MVEELGNTKNKKRIQGKKKIMKEKSEERQNWQQAASETRFFLKGEDKGKLENKKSG